MAVNENTEIRNLPYVELRNIAMILHIWGEPWKKLAIAASKEISEDCLCKIDEKFIRIIEYASRHERKPAAAIFLIEWATMGEMRRPTVGLLLQLLIEAELFRAAEYVAFHTLKGEAVVWPAYGAAARIDCGAALIEFLEQRKPDVPVPER